MAPKIKQLESIRDLEIGDVVALSEDGITALFVGIQLYWGKYNGVFLSRRVEGQTMYIDQTLIPEGMMDVREGAVVSLRGDGERYPRYRTYSFTGDDDKFRIFPDYDASLAEAGL